MPLVKNLLRFSVVSLIHALMLPSATLAGPAVIVTHEEAAASDAAGGLMTPRIAPSGMAPRIEFVAPDIGRPVSVPTNIELRFFTEPPAELKPDTFKVFYGAFRIDITQRLTGVARVTKDGISVTEATLPIGKHQLLLSVTDSLGRESQRLVVLTVQ